MNKKYNEAIELMNEASKLYIQTNNIENYKTGVVEHYQKVMEKIIKKGLESVTVNNKIKLDGLLKTAKSSIDKILDEELDDFYSYHFALLQVLAVKGLFVADDLKQMTEFAKTFKVKGMKEMMEIIIDKIKKR